jgi:hypothetical protein
MVAMVVVVALRAVALEEEAVVVVAVSTGCL